MSLKGRQQKAKHTRIKGKPGRVIGTVGRRVMVRDVEGERVCYLSGQRAVIGDRVRWEEAPGTGGKLVGVEDRDTVLRRRDLQGKERILAANLRGIVVVATPCLPDFDPMLIDRYLVAANAAGLDSHICVNKIDLGETDAVINYLQEREALGYKAFRVSAKEGGGLSEFEAFLQTHSGDGRGPLALVGLSGVGKTSLLAALLPEEDVGPIGELSEYWEQGRHTTTGSRLFDLADGGELVDSPGIRTFSPAGLKAAEVRDYFPGFSDLHCQFRDCLHQEGQKGCVVGDELSEHTIKGYRRLMEYLGKQKPSY